MTRQASVRVLDSRPAFSQPLPRLPANHVPRPRLSRVLRDSACRLTLISAPAGFGKSVLLAECARQVPSGTRLVWLDLLGRPLTPAELLGRLSAVLQRPLESGDPQTLLGNLLSSIDQPLWIVLDDYPRQPCPELDDCLDRLLEQTPASLRWWIGGRRRPSWNLPRLLLQGDLLEVDAQALAFNEDELRGLLGDQHPDVHGELVARLLHDCEGWPAGICLLLFKTDATGLRERLAAGSTLLEDYIEREVLRDLPPALVQHLRVLAHIPRFSAELCGQLLDEDGNALLDELLGRQLFLRGLDSAGQWFRLWRPLALILRRQSGGQPIQAHLRACRWFFLHGDPREAVEHALWAEQPEVAASYLQRFGQEQLLVGHSVTQFLQWRAELPAYLFASTPRLIFLLGWALVTCGRFDEVDDVLADLSRFLPQADARRQRQLLAHWQALQGMLMRQRGLPGARQHCREALAGLSESAWSQRVLCYQALAQQAMAQTELDEAQRCCEEGLFQARHSGSLIYEGLLNVERIHLHGMRGEFALGVELAEQTIGQVSTALRHGPVIGRLHMLRGAMLAAQGRYEEAGNAYRRGMREAERCEDAYRLFGYFGLIELVADQGDFTQALNLLQEAERVMQWQHVPEERYHAVLQLAGGLLHLRRGEPRQARELFQALLERYRQRGLLAPSSFYCLMLRARFGLALCDLRLGRLGAAQEALLALRDESLVAGHAPLVCECRFALAEAMLTAGRAYQAELELRRALGEAQRMRLLRPLQAFFRLHPELVLRLASPAQRESLQLLQQAHEEELPRDDNSPLSSRELAVLALIAQGLSNQEIAERLFISLHTVKTHARRIHSKLKVERRTQAVAQAKALGLLD
ncbi:LuxR C-terminal-related transcriptional regulator [Zestomonas carbonaria]|uniref:HTH-type transcriptional regulator MalT n=1 Tax=Zestomonas carbonaria TaxID=2762745 RepID=A0A7U7EKS8_9GAMM|nr:LuxR C-terminal-related transcriptional regulator [Pseudomonas carbonaria]CAD5106696.1 HTH-type transcriptional regulator MalT [Pseudomonas carbonaria]